MSSSAVCLLAMTLGLGAALRTRQAQQQKFSSEATAFSKIVSVVMASHIVNDMSRTLRDSVLQMSDHEKVSENAQTIRWHMKACTPPRSNKSSYVNTMSLWLTLRSSIDRRVEISEASGNMKKQLDCIETRVKNTKQLAQIVLHARQELAKKKLYRVCGMSLHEVVNRCLAAALKDVYSRLGPNSTHTGDQTHPSSGHRHDSALDVSNDSIAKNSSLDSDVGSEQAQQLVTVLQEWTDSTALSTNMVETNCARVLEQQIRPIILESAITDPGSTCALPFSTLSDEERQTQAAQMNRSALFENVMASERVRYSFASDCTVIFRLFTESLRTHLKGEHFM